MGPSPLVFPTLILQLGGGGGGEWSKGRSVTVNFHSTLFSTIWGVGLGKLVDVVG